jgi:hypothetical protein
MMRTFAKTLLQIPSVLVGVFLAGCSLQTDSGGLGFDEPEPGIPPPGHDGTGDSGAGDTDAGETDPDDTSGAVDDTGDDGDTSDEPGGTGSGGGGATSIGDDPGDSGSDDTGAGDTTSGDTGTAGGAGDQPTSGMYSHCLSVNDCDPGFGCLTNDTATDGFCSILCSPVGDPSGCDPDPGGVLDPICTVAGGGESVCALDCSGGESCPAGMVCTADSLICM